MDEVLALKNTDIANELCLPPVKLHYWSEYMCLLKFLFYSEN